MWLVQHVSSAACNGARAAGLVGWSAVRLPYSATEGLGGQVSIINYLSIESYKGNAGN